MGQHILENIDPNNHILVVAPGPKANLVKRDSQSKNTKRNIIFAPKNHFNGTEITLSKRGTKKDLVRESTRSVIMLAIQFSFMLCINCYFYLV